jgi:hypothetical protein
MIIDATEWRQLPWAASYDVCSSGEVRKRINAAHPERRQILILRRQADKDGYLYLRIAGKKWLIHRLVFATFCSPLVPGLVICHRDGNKLNNRVENLLQATQRENILHKAAHGTWQAGEKHARAKYTNAEIAQIKARIASATRTATGRIRRGEGQRLAMECGVPSDMISALAHGKSWKHV